MNWILRHTCRSLNLNHVRQGVSQSWETFRSCFLSSSAWPERILVLPFPSLSLLRLPRLCIMQTRKTIARNWISISTRQVMKSQPRPLSHTLLGQNARNSSFQRLLPWIKHFGGPDLNLTLCSENSQNSESKCFKVFRQSFKWHLPKDKNRRLKNGEVQGLEWD